MSSSAGDSATDRAPPPAAEVVIVGAGAAGCLYAAELARAGRDVVVLEAGPAWQLDDLMSSQLWARRLKWRGDAVTSEGNTRVGHAAATGSGLGGAALHHYATWPRMPVDAFRMRERHGVGMDWPFDYEELRPWYDRIQSDVGIAGDASREPWRPPGEPYPLPPVRVFAQGEVLARGFERLELDVAPLPAAIATARYRGRPPCLWDGWCDAGCPTGALANPLVIHHPQAAAAGARFYTRCEVTRVLTDPHGRARAVEFMRAGERRSCAAEVVVLAASVVQNPRILLNSGSVRHPHGLANEHGLVGACFMAEANAFVFGLFEKTTDPWLGINAGQLMHRSGLRHPGKSDLVGGTQWQIAPAMKPNDLFGIAITRPELFGNALDHFIREGVRHLGALVGFAGGVPQRSNRIELAQARDRHGVPLARIVYSHDRHTLALFEYMREQGLAVMRAGGARESWLGPQATGHQSGGTIMGVDPRDSIVDAWGFAHTVPNLAITGAGLFPTTGAASPTYTIYAVALRSVRHLIEHWSGRAR